MAETSNRLLNADIPTDKGVNTELIFELSLDIGERLDLGLPACGRRVIAPIIGGTFEGPKLKGIVIPGGADWTLTRPDGIRELDVRVTLKTDSGDLIYMRYRGIDNTKPDIAKKIAKGEPVDPSEYYFRTTPIFETTAQNTRWLNNIVAIGTGRKAARGPVYKVFAVL
jgi:hypothetical protein